MNRKFTESKAVAALKKQESGIPVKDICKEFGICNATFYNWKEKYGEISVNEANRVYKLEKENAELKRMFAEMGLENRALRNQLEKRN
jgi:putative transposase